MAIAFVPGENTGLVANDNRNARQKSGTILKRKPLRMEGERAYQALKVAEILKLFETHDEVCLAAGTGTGKTEMSIEVERRVWEEGMKTNENRRSLFLAHGTTVILDNAALRFNTYELPFKYEVYGGDHGIGAKCNLGCPSHGLGTSKDVLVTIPQCVHDKDIGRFYLGVFDEAHQFVPKDDPEAEGDEKKEAMMVSKIIKNCGFTKRLYVTATPSMYVKRGVPLVVFSLLDALEAGVVSNAHIQLGVSEYMVDLKDFNQDGEITKSSSEQAMTKEATFKTMYSAQHTLLAALSRKVALEANTPDRPGVETQVSVGAPSHNEVWSKTGKVMVVAHDRHQANFIKQFFDSEAIEAAVSDYESDRSSARFNDFTKPDSTTSVLIVIFRGNLGFDFKDLSAVVDLSETRSPNRLMQMLGRVARKSETVQKKIFIKMVSPRMKEYQEHLMGFVMMLAHEKTVREWDGRNPLDIAIPKFPDAPTGEGGLGGGGETPGGGGGGGSRGGPEKDPRPLTGLTLKDFFNRCDPCGSDAIHFYAKTTLRQVAAKYNGIAMRRDWASELLIHASKEMGVPDPKLHHELNERYYQLCTKGTDKFVPGFKERFQACVRNAKRHAMKKKDDLAK